MNSTNFIRDERISYSLRQLGDKTIYLSTAGYTG